MPAQAVTDWIASNLYRLCQSFIHTIEESRSLLSVPVETEQVVPG